MAQDNKRVYYEVVIFKSASIQVIDKKVKMPAWRMGGSTKCFSIESEGLCSPR